ncbi:hypothetical protein ACVIWV_001072 [Bradyrhizobium diazoefficiens]
MPIAGLDGCPSVSDVDWCLPTDLKDFTFVTKPVQRVTAMLFRSNLGCCVKWDLVIVGLPISVAQAKAEHVVNVGDVL